MAENIVVVTRGDTHNLTLLITDDHGGIYKLTPEDKLYFGIMRPHDLFENAFIRKKITLEDVLGPNPSPESIASWDGSITIILEPADTVCCAGGVYYYSVKLHRIVSSEGIDEINTIINNTKLVIDD